MEDGKPKLERRELLLGTALGVGAIALSSSSAHAQSPNDSRVISKSILPGSIPQPTFPKNYKTLVGAIDPRFSLKDKDEDADENTLPAINTPIDQGADSLLNTIVRAPLGYSPFEVEYLSSTLTEHVENCLLIRERGQELETQAMFTRLNLELTSQMVELQDSQRKFEFENAHLRMKDLLKPRLETDTGFIIGDAPNPKDENDYFTQMNRIDAASIAYQKASLEKQRVLITEEASGANHVQRFKFQKRIFDLELKEAYERAKSVSIGMKEVYGITDHNLPEVTRNGYLDELALWTKVAAYRIERKLLERVRSVLMIPFWSSEENHGLMSDTDFENQKKIGHFTFKITRELLEAYNYNLNAKPLLRSVELVFWNSSTENKINDLADSTKSDPFPASITLPSRKIQDSWGGTTYTKIPEVLLAPIGPYQQREYGFKDARQVHNLTLNPNDEWQVRISKSPIFGSPVSKNIMANIGLIIGYSKEQ